MGQLPVPALVGFPARFDARFIRTYPLLPARKMSWQGKLLLVSCGKRLLDQRSITIPARFEPINFPAQTGLPPINASSIQKDRTAHLTIRLASFRLFQDRDGDERPHAPIKTQHTGFLL